MVDDGRVTSCTHSCTWPATFAVQSTLISKGLLSSGSAAHIPGPSGCVRAGHTGMPGFCRAHQLDLLRCSARVRYPTVACSELSNFEWHFSTSNDPDSRANTGTQTGNNMSRRGVSSNRSSSDLSLGRHSTSKIRRAFVCR